ncbi:hypothetical protein PghCCS26_19190 [Paenibacillus glycanilyticus]|uniref:Ketosteroid isomerase n=1 Tax=Paenibacillus glycanilyticus TaxID=126569 RepID=A0ABQ6NI51_9BACL|nr:nuclear transport factor 2 family protein [Paenibacillus glycanilyticus]GMK44791.1 hypothetical protein PghCCS26_19190 [Paenibacillus glycanilyticus]
MHKSIGTRMSRTYDAFDAFKHAFETGKTIHFLQRVTEDFRFRVPLPLEGWNNEQYGKERFEELIRFERSVLQAYFTPILVLENEDNGIVVFRAEGILNGKSYLNELTVVYEYEEDRIRSFREYVGTPLKNYEAP